MRFWKSCFWSSWICARSGSFASRCIEHVPSTLRVQARLGRRSAPIRPFELEGEARAQVFSRWHYRYHYQLLGVAIEVLGRGGESPV